MGIKGIEHLDAETASRNEISDFWKQPLSNTHWRIHRIGVADPERSVHTLEEHS